MLELIIMFLLFLVVLVAIWFGLTKSKFGNKHFCYKDGKSLYPCGNGNISVCSSDNSNIEKVCNSINNHTNENFTATDNMPQCIYCMSMCVNETKKSDTFLTDENQTLIANTNTCIFDKINSCTSTDCKGVDVQDMYNWIKIDPDDPWGEDPKNTWGHDPYGFKKV